MNIFPCSIRGRVLRILWLAACATLLVYAFSQRNIHEPDIDLTFTLAMLALTFPIGYVLGTLGGFIFLFLYKSYGIVIPGGFLPNAISWIFFVAAGYYQWFVLLPWLYRKGNNK
jgi:hypothetical protein